MRNSSLITALVLLFLTACSNPRVHLHTQGLEPQRESALAKQIEEAGFEVQLKGNKHPKASRGNLVLTPSYGGTDAEVLARLQNVLEAQGYITDALPSPLGNHIYSSNNFGVYLVKPSDAGDIIVQMAREEWPLSQFEFLTQDCDTRYALWLNDDGVARLFNEEFDLEFSWHKSASAAILESPDGLFQFEIVQKIYSRGQRKHVDVYLEPSKRYPLPYACTFKGGMVFSM